MLVLSRKKNETVVVGDSEVVITVIDIRGDKVRLGIDADRSITVHRGEIFRLIQERNAAEAAE